MTTPSFIFVPSVYKQGLIYAELPADGSGDLTVSRGSVATRFNEDGLIELMVRNLCFNSQDWTSNWSANGVTVGANSTGFTAPNGGSTANAIVPTATNAVHRLSSNSTTAISYVSGQVYTASAHFAAGRGAAGRYVQLTLPSGAFSQGGFANFDLVDGTVTLVGGGTDANRSASIVNVGGGWFRCVFTATCNVTASTTGANVVLITAPNATLAPTFLGSTGDLLFGWGAQVEDGRAVSEYQRADTGRFNIPRLDYLQPDGTVGCPALLVEPSAQNLALHSSDFTTWNQQNSLTVNPNTAISPDGTQNADTINIAPFVDSRLTQVITVANSTTYTISCFYKNIALTAGETFNMRFNNFLTAPNNLLATATIDLAAGTATYTIGGTAVTGFSGTATGRIENYGNGWYRVSMTFTVGSAGGNAGGFQTAQVGSATARSFYAWGAQLEVGSVATSYIPTTTAAVTRSADTVEKTGISSLIGQVEGTLYVECEANTETDEVISINRQQFNSVILTKDANNGYVGRVFHSLAGFVGFTFTTANNITGFVKIAIAYKSGDSAMFMNGVQVGTTNTSVWAFQAPLSGFHINGAPSISNSVRPHRIRASALFTSRLTAEELIIRTAPIYNENLADSIWENYLARPSLSTELPECLRARHNEIITI